MVLRPLTVLLGLRSIFVIQGDFMRAFLIAVLIGSCSWAGAQTPIRDIRYHFDQEKVHAASDVYEFTTSFAEYFYALLNHNRGNLSTVADLQSEEAWCAGDAHPKNFGALILSDGDSVFTLNDMDDAGPCPVVMDLLRFLLTAQLAEAKVRPEELVANYLDGVSGAPASIPKAVNALLQQSRNAGTPPTPEDLEKSGMRLKRTGKSREVTGGEGSELRLLMQTLVPDHQVLDIYAKEKIGGGSNGVLRFEILLQGPSALLHLELKGQPGPAIQVVAPSPVPEQSERIRRTIELEMGAKASPLYRVVKVGGQDMLLRPRFNGNIGVKLSAGDKKVWLKHEAFQLGYFHSQTLKSPGRWVSAVRQESWSADVQSLKSHFRQKFKDVSEVE